MSSILLSNPFVTPPTPPVAWGTPDTRLAVAPVNPSQASGDSSGQKGSGKGSGGSSDSQALLRGGKASVERERPSNAAPWSVIMAQAQKSRDRDEDARFMPDFRMPDPLPTSPYLKPA